MEIIYYSQQAGGISPWHRGPQKRGDPQLQKTKQPSYKAVPSGGLLHCPTSHRAGKAETIPSIPSPMEWCWKSYPKTKTESSKWQPVWGRRVHLLCLVGVSRTTSRVWRKGWCAIENEDVNPWKSLHAKVTQLLDCSWGFVFYTAHKRKLAFHGADLRDIVLKHTKMSATWVHTWCIFLCPLWEPCETGAKGCSSMFWFKKR